MPPELRLQAGLLLDVAVIGASDGAAFTAVLLVETVLVLAGYPIVAEWTTRGRTVGKACMGLRVVRDNGGPIGFRHALVRGLAGLVLNKRAGQQNLCIAPLWVPPPLQPWAVTLDLHRLDDALALRLNQFISRANGFTSAAQFALGEDLRRRVQAVVAPPPPPDAPTPVV